MFSETSQILSAEGESIVSKHSLDRSLTSTWSGVRWSGSLPVANPTVQELKKGKCKARTHALNEQEKKLHITCHERRRAADADGPTLIKRNSGGICGILVADLRHKEWQRGSIQAKIDFFRRHRARIAPEISENSTSGARSDAQSIVIVNCSAFYGNLIVDLIVRQSWATSGNVRPWQRRLMRAGVARAAGGIRRDSGDDDQEDLIDVSTTR
ncbi:hypothetical protein B0H11DRAFT_1936080 [Mycena galericulata]|nr:hypothetical protein B0H11DRAFT_1936080 [Mycena galericulata]